MSKKIALLIVILLSLYSLYAQDSLKTQKNSLSFELGGTHKTYSLCYERNIINKYNINISSEFAHTYLKTSIHILNTNKTLKQNFNLINLRTNIKYSKFKIQPEIGIGITYRIVNRNFYPYSITAVSLNSYIQSTGNLFSIFRIGFNYILTKNFYIKGLFCIENGYHNSSKLPFNHADYNIKSTTIRLTNKRLGITLGYKF